MRKKKLTRQLVMVEWGDAWVHGAWDDEASSKSKAKPVTVFTVGWLLRKNSRGVLVAAQIADGTQLANQSFIPKGMIRSIRVLRQGTLRQR